MKTVATLLILIAMTFGACKQKEVTVKASSGVNTSRSNVKNNIDTDEKKEAEKKVEEKKKDYFLK